MNRTAEKVLSIISIVLNLVSLGLIILFVFGSQLVINDPLFEEELEKSLYSPEFSGADVESAVTFTQDAFQFVSSLGWVFVLIVVVSIVLTIIGIVQVNKNSKLAGILFLIASILAGLVSFAGILLMIVAIMCFVRKPKMPIQQSSEIDYQEY